jgi:uncharacterized protein (UPF0335 family)
MLKSIVKENIEKIHIMTHNSDIKNTASGNAIDACAMAVLEELKKNNEQSNMQLDIKDITAKYRECAERIKEFQLSGEVQEGDIDVLRINLRKACDLLDEMFEKIEKITQEHTNHKNAILEIITKLPTLFTAIKK